MWLCVQSIKGSAFSIAIDGSSDTGLEKMNPVTVRFFDLHDDKVATRFHDLCSSNVPQRAGFIPFG